MCTPVNYIDLELGALPSKKSSAFAKDFFKIQSNMIVCASATLSRSFDSSLSLVTEHHFTKWTDPCQLVVGENDNIFMYLFEFRKCECGITDGAPCSLLLNGTSCAFKLLKSHASNLRQLISRYYLSTKFYISCYCLHSTIITSL